jgi:hypothetical protein
MIETHLRPINSFERRQLLSRQASSWKKFERIAMKFIIVLLVFLAPLLIADSLLEIPPQKELATLIVLLLGAVAVTFRWQKKDPEVIYETHSKKMSYTGQVEVVRCKTTRAVKREDPEDFGVAFYIDTGDGRTLFLQGQYLDILEDEKQFPNTEFELYRLEETQEILDFKVSGKYFAPEKTLAAFTKEDYKKGIVPEDGNILETSIDKIK